MSRKDKRHYVDAKTAVEMADEMDLPDGAYFAMVGDLMGGDYMDGVEAVMASDGVPMIKEKPPVELPQDQVLALADFGRLVRCDPHHYQIRQGKTVVADFWPNAKKPKWRVGKSGVATVGSPLDLAKALQGDERSQKILRHVTAAELADALRWVLPMAKGYAAAHPVGGNEAIVKDAEALLQKTGGL